MKKLNKKDIDRIQKEFESTLTKDNDQDFESLLSEFSGDEIDLDNFTLDKLYNKKSKCKITLGGYNKKLRELKVEMDNLNKKAASIENKISMSESMLNILDIQIDELEDLLNVTH